MASEFTSPMPANGPGAPGSGANGWPDRKAKSGDDWGRLHFVPQPGDNDRLHIFAQPVTMTKEEENRILSNWNKIAQGHGRSFAMAHDLRPSTPRDVRAENRIQQLKDEGVKVDREMETHMRNIIECNSGLHEALRHYTQDESNVLIPYLNEHANREDRMLLEWAKQRKHDFDLWQESLSLRGSSRRSPSERVPSQKGSSHKAKSTEGSSTFDYDQGLIVVNSTGDQSPGDHKAPSNGKSSITFQSNSSIEDKAPSQGESSSTSQGKKGLVHAQIEADAKKRSLQQGKTDIILNLDAQLSNLDRRLEGLGANSSQPSSSTRASSSSDQDPFDRIIELLRNVIEDKQRTLNSLNKARSKIIRGVEANGTPSPLPSAQPDGQVTPQRGISKPASGGFMGTLRDAWNRCIDASDSPESSRAGSRGDSRDDSIQLGPQNHPPRTPTMVVPPPLSPFTSEPFQNEQGVHSKP